MSQRTARLCLRRSGSLIPLVKGTHVWSPFRRPHDTNTAPSAPLRSEPQRTSPSISSLRALRYVALVAQLVTLLSVQWIWDPSPPWHIFGPLLGVLLLTNILLPNLRSVLNAADIIGLTIFLDVALLTIALASFGGPENPFTVLYLVQLTLVATMSTRRWTWLITVATSWSTLKSHKAQL